jgi:hypothetical protein
MTKAEAIEWFEDKRDMGDVIPQFFKHDGINYQDDGTCIVRTEQANAAKLEQAYWILRAHKEGLIK